MRRFLVPAALSTLLYFIWNFSTTGFRVSAGWGVDWPYFFLGVFYWPAAFLAWMVTTISILCLFQSKAKAIPIVVIALAAPMLGYSLYYPEYTTMKKWNAQGDLKRQWWEDSQFLNSLLLRYVRDHRDQIKWSGGDEEIISTGFISYLNSLPPSALRRPDRRKLRIKVTEKNIMTPWGCPIVFGVDRNSDGYLQLLGEKASLKPGYADPWGDGNFSYTIGVGCTPEWIPKEIYDPSEQNISTLDDGTFNRLYEIETR